VIAAILYYFHFKKVIDQKKLARTLGDEMKKIEVSPLVIVFRERRV